MKKNEREREKKLVHEEIFVEMKNAYVDDIRMDMNG